MEKQKKSQVKIEQFIQFTLTCAGFQKGIDFTIILGQLRIIKNPLRGKLLTTLKESYPQYSYYWETPKISRWF